MENNALILIVDDDEGIRTVVKLLLESKGYKVLTASSGYEAIESVNANHEIDLIILDVMMPGMDGMETCGKLRETTNAPILFLTAKTSEKDKLSAYEQGGDDFLGKPFSQAELVAKVNSLLRRYTVYRSKVPQKDGIEINHEERIVTKNGEPIELTDLEFDILAYLFSKRGVTVSVKDLYENVWNEKFLSSSANTIMVHILNLRKKIEENAGNPTIIKTVWGSGYKID